LIKIVAYCFLVLYSFLLSQEKDIIQTLEDYNDAFVAEDYKNIPYFFDFPVSFNLKDKSIIAGNKLKLKLIYKKLRGGLPENYKYSKWEDFNIQVLDEKVAIVDASFSRYNEDGSILYSGNGFYSLRKIDNKWKIYALTPYDNIIRSTD
tara:strand:+ start:198 stop:644 length:447 start_codon:yes stop_codon:yes gene_type:complete